MKTVLTIMGKVTLSRAYYYDRHSGEGVCPYDKALDLEGTSFSSGMRRIMGRVGAYQSFGLGHEDIKELAGVDVTAKEVERIAEAIGAQAAEYLSAAQTPPDASHRAAAPESIPILYVTMDGTGVPMTRSETDGRKGKGSDGQSRTREAKLGCVFTQTTTDEHGYPVRDEGSTTYIGKIETSEAFGKQLYQEAVNRGIDHAKRVCVLGDAAAWIDTIGQDHFPGATYIVDLYHAREHYWNVAHVFFGKNDKKRHQWAERRKKELNAGAVTKVMKAIERLNPTTEEQREVCRQEIKYFHNNKDRMHYDRYRREGLFVGSGVIEAGCRTIVAQRLKLSGMQWTVNGANSILALRCCLFSHRWEDFWANRAAA
jgi:hypothetical protein